MILTHVLFFGHSFVVRFGHFFCCNFVLVFVLFSIVFRGLAQALSIQHSAIFDTFENNFLNPLENSISTNFSEQNLTKTTVNIRAGKSIGITVSQYIMLFYCIAKLFHMKLSTLLYFFIF